MLNEPIRVAVCGPNAKDVRQAIRRAIGSAGQDAIPCETVFFPDAAAMLASGERLDAAMLEASELDDEALVQTLARHSGRISLILMAEDGGLALRGYEAGASRYLVRPLQQEKLREALAHVAGERLNRRCLMLPTPQGERRLLLRDVRYVETQGRGVCVVLRDGRQETVKMKISELEALLPASFALCHRTVLVNLACARYLRHGELELTTGEILPVSKYRHSEIRERMLDFPGE